MPEIILLNDIKFEGVKNLPLLQIENIESNIDLSIYDSLVFTSKNAIYSLNSFNTKWKELDSYAIAPKTAEVIKKEGGKVVFTGFSSHGNDFAKELIPLLRDKKVLYVRASKTVSSLVEFLKNDHINLDELITYKTICNTYLEKIIIKNNSIIIFSSPSTISCFFKNYAWNKSYKAVVIGKTTASYLPSDIEYVLSPSTSLKKCIEVAKSL